MKIVFNGVEYDGVDAMPPDARRTFERLFPDEDRDGVPDLLQRARANVGAQTTTYEVNGRSYASIEDMPPDVRRTFEELARVSERLRARDEKRAPADALPDGSTRPEASRPPEPQLRGRDHGWGEVAPQRSMLPWVLVVVLAATLAAVLLAR